MGDPPVSKASKIDEVWIKHFTEHLAAFTGESVESLRPTVERFSEGITVSTTVTQVKVEGAGGSALRTATVGAAIKLRLSALNAKGEVVRNFTGTASLSTAAKCLPTEPTVTPAFVAGVLDNFEIKFKNPGTAVSLLAAVDGASGASVAFHVMPAMIKPRGPGKQMDVYNKTEKARAVLAEPPENPGSAMLAELRLRRQAFGLNDAGVHSELAKKSGYFSPNYEENCGAVSMGAICGKTSTQVAKDFLLSKLRPAITQKVTREHPELAGTDLERAVDEMLEKYAEDYKSIQNQTLYWRAESLENLAHNFDAPKEGMPTNPYGEECGEAQLAANREMLVAEANRRNEGGGIGGIKFKVIQDGLNDSDNGKFYDPTNGELQAQMAKYPDGTQFQVFMNGPTFAGHWLYGEKYNGKVVIEDYQKAVAAGKKGATAYTDGDVPHNPKNDEPNVFVRACFIALCPESADPVAIGAWAENPKWPQGGTPSRVVEPKVTAPVEPSGPEAPQSEVLQAVTDGSVTAKLGDPEFRRGLLKYLDQPGRPDPDASKTLLAAFRTAPEGDSNLREKVFKKVFDCKLTSEGALPPKILSKMVDVLETLPQDLLPKAWKMKGARGKYTTGMYNPDTRGGEITYGIDDAPEFDESYDANCPEPEMALRGSKNFDLIIRHEVGHDVDVKQGGSDLTSKPACGAWLLHGTLKTVLGTMGGLLDDYIDTLEEAVKTLGVEFKEKVKAELKGSIETLVTQAACVDNAAWKSNFASLLAEGRLIPKAEASTIAAVVPVDHELVHLLYQGARDDNWAHLSSPPRTLNGRVYLLKSDGDWYSFDVASWGKRISNYQYASPGEWFAEFYAGVNNADKGIRLKCGAAYPEAKSWMASKNLLLHPNE